MAVDLQKPVRRALLTQLKADTGLVALVPVASINPDGAPVWPFIKLHAPRTQRYRAACVIGGIVVWDIHAYAGARKDGSGAIVETSEDHAGSIGGAIETAIADNRLALEDGGIARITLSDIQLLEDGDPDHYHWFAQITARVLAA